MTDANRISDRLVERLGENGRIVWPVSLDQLKLHCQVHHDADDGMLVNDELGVLPAATEFVEGRCGVALTRQTRRLTLDGGPAGRRWLELRWPLESVETVTYLTPSGDELEADAETWRIDRNSHPGRLIPSRATGWPAVSEEPASYWVDYTTGYAPRKCTALWSQAVLSLSTYWWNHRDAFAARDMDKKQANAMDRMYRRAGWVERAR